MEQKLCVLPEVSIRDAISVLVEGGKKVVFVVSPDQKLLGIMTNGDMRRFLLTGKSLSLPVTDAMNPHPTVFHTVEDAQAEKSHNAYIVYPIVSPEGILMDALFPDEYEAATQASNTLENVPLVIMAGGKGTRLYPYTKILPKAIIPIGQYSIVERIIHSFHKYGCKKVYMILNHKASIIRAYMSEVDTQCEIDYVQETQFSGTAGGLCLLEGKLNSTFILSNCDILINDDLACAYKTHVAQGNAITYICSMKNYTVPYGIIETTPEGQIRCIKEKPQYSFLANTGVYILEPSVLKEIHAGEFIHITDLTTRCIEKGMRVGVFPISEKSWLDMGQLDELEHMRQELNVDI